MERLKIGVVGISRGSAYVEAFGQGKRSEITALCDVDEAQLDDAAATLQLDSSHLFTDYDAFLESDIDAVIVGTPIPFHEEQVVRALAADKHVLCEVTAAHTLEGCRRIYEAAKRAKAKYMMAENYIWLDYIQQWKKWVDDGHIGRIHYAEAEYVHDIRDLLVDPSTGASFWRTYRPPIHYCSHCLGPLLYLLGDDYIVKATAFGNRNTILEEHWPSSIDMQVALFETKHGRIIKILRSQVTPRTPHTVTYCVYGTEGLLDSGREPGYDTIGTRFFERVDRQGIPLNCNGTSLEVPKELAFGGHGTSDYFTAHAFLDAVEYDLEPLVNVDRAMELTIPGLIAHEAAVRGHVWLDVPRF